MSDSGQKNVLIVGNYRTSEMVAVVDAVNDICGESHITYVDNVGQIPAECIIPELIIICQNWPDEFSLRDLHDLFNRFPVNRMICCYGVWCESDGRTRSIIPLSIRVPARSAQVRIQHEWDIIHRKAEVFPLTAGRDEIFLFETPNEPFRIDSVSRIPRICVISSDSFYQTMLQEMIHSWNGQILGEARMNDADLIIYDLDPWELVSGILPNYQFVSPVVGLMGLAHPESIVAAQQLGCETVICKAAPEKELFQAIESSLILKAIPLAEN